MSIVTFKDADGVEQTLDLKQKFNVAFHADCRDILRAMPDQCIDLIVADPPYGSGLTENGGCQGWFSKYHQDSTEHRNLRGRFDKYNGSSQTVNVERIAPSYNRFGSPGSRFEKYKRSPEWDMGGEVRKKIIAWDVAPGKEVFDELFRVSREQIIWGGNYFELPPTRCFLIWRKLTISESFTMAMAEYAWTSFNSNAKVFECAPQGKPGDERFHPTQKPIDLYRWIFRLYAKPGMTVFDPFLGSGSSRIAAYEAGLNFIGCEIDQVYFRKQEERFERMTDNYSMFD